MKTSTLPQQRLPRSKKDKDWGIATMKALLSEAKFPSTASSFGKFYDAYNGILNTMEYDYVTDPYKSEEWKTKKFPAKIRNYNIIKPVIDILLGEKSRRPLNYHVVVKNPDTVSNKEEAEKQEVIRNVYQQYVNELNAQGVDTQIPSEEIPPPEQVVREFNEKYKDTRAIMGEEGLEIILAECGIEDKFMLGFFDWLITGYVFTYKGVAFDDVEYDIVNPLDLAYDKSPDVVFIEDGRYAIRRNRMSTNEILDKFHDILSEEDIDYLEGGSRTNNSGIYLSNIAPAHSNSLDEDLHDVYHFTWKSMTKTGILTYLNPMTGEIEEMVVSEFYKPVEGESVKWEWMNEVFEGYEIGGNIYTLAEPIRAQRTTMNNPSKCKLPYNGRALSDRNSENVSVVALGLPYQILYNIFHYRMELSVAKNKDKIMLMEINMIPKRHGWTQDKFMYHADAMGFAYIDSTAEGQAGEKLGFNGFQVLDMSLGKYIESQLNLLETIKMEWEESLGINRQRKGQVLASDGKGVTEQALTQSSVITEEIFRKFETCEQRDLQGLIDVSQIAWSKGKKGAYINSSFKTVYIDINPIEYCSSEFGLFVVNSAKEIAKLNNLRSLALEFAQNKARPSTIAEILEGSNFAQVKRKLREVEEAEAQMQQANEQAQQEHEQLIQQMVLAQREDEQAHEMERTRVEIEGKIMVEQIKIDATLFGADVNGNGEMDINELEKRNLDREKFYMDLSEKRSARMDQVLLKKQELQLKDKQIDTQLKIAKENKNKYDKKK